MINKNISIKLLINGIIIMFMMCTSFWLISYVAEHIFESMSPSSRRYQYESIEPIKDSYKSGEKLKFLTKVQRFRGLYVRWEDTLYCTDGTNKVMQKYPTQYRPENGRYEYKTSLTKFGVWKYSYLIDTSETSCTMCGTVISKTTYGYEKIHNYCTQSFEVNR